ncbi:MAG: hypothetical protein ACRDX8_03460 [Acidimicrobiales bacterium]
MVLRCLRRGCWVLGWLGLCVIAASCGTATPAPPGATVPDSVLGQPPPSPYAVPKVITKAYVTKVLAALEAVESEATANIVAHHGFTPTAAALIRSVTTESEFTAERQIWLNDATSGLRNIPKHPRPIVDAVQRVFPSTPSCIFVSAIRNAHAAVIDPPPRHVSYFVLHAGTTSSPNPTPWLIDKVGYNPTGPPPVRNY